MTRGLHDRPRKQMSHYKAEKYASPILADRARTLGVYVSHIYIYIYTGFTRLKKTSNKKHREPDFRPEAECRRGFLHTVLRMDFWPMFF